LPQRQRRIASRRAPEAEAARSRESKARLPRVDRSQQDSVDFGPLASLIGYRIRRAYGRVFQSFNELFTTLDVAFGQYSLLLLIGLNPGLSQMTLADAGGIDRSTVVPIIERFVRLGWVRRTRRRGDRRRYALRVTPAGQAILDRSQTLIATHEQRLVQSLTGSERYQLLSLLARISEEKIPTLRIAAEGSASETLRSSVPTPE
jgi:DNA-binding MarR family transcriptional regulator